MDYYPLGCVRFLCAYAMRSSDDIDYYFALNVRKSNIVLIAP